MSARFTTDSLNPAALPSATLGRRRPPTTIPPASSSLLDNPSDGQSSTRSRTDVDLDKERDEWNLRIDKEIKGLVGGLKGLVEMADITPNPQSSSTTLLPLHLKIQTSTLIRSAQNLRNLAHQLKLLLLLSDEVEIARKRDLEAGMIRSDVQRLRHEVVDALGTLLGGENQAQVEDKVTDTTKPGVEEENPGGGGDVNMEKGETGIPVVDGVEVQLEAIDVRPELDVDRIDAERDEMEIDQVNEDPSGRYQGNKGNKDEDDDEDDFEEVEA